jgi:hypothetical protein
MSQGTPPPDPNQPARPQGSATAGLGLADSDAATRRMSLADLAADHPASRIDRALQWFPRILSSKPHIIFLALLGVYLVLLPLFGIVVSAKSELIGGNYTNVTSDIGACIAAGGTLHLINQSRKRQKLDAERLRLLKEIHSLMHHVHPEVAAQLGHVMPPAPGSDSR